MTGFPDDPRAFGSDADDDTPGASRTDQGAGRGPDGGAPAAGGPSADLWAGLDDADGADPVETLLRPPGEFLHAPPGAFERIRGRAARRRRARAAAGGAVVAALITGSVYVAGTLSPHGSGEVVGPPATSTKVTGPAPVTTRPAVTPAPSSGGRTPTTGQSPATPSPATTVPNRTGGTPPTPTASTPQCTADQLDATLGGSDAGAGNLYRYLVLTNRSDRACRVIGFPGVSLLDAGGRQIGAPATREALSYQPVTLAPGAVASDTIHTVNHQGTCRPTSTQLRLYPPSSRASLLVPAAITICDDVFTITPFAPGPTGNPPN